MEALALTRQLFTQTHDLRVGIVYDLVHLRTERGVLVGQASG